MEQEKKTLMLNRMTDRARKVMRLANQEAQRFNQEYIDSEHILLGLIGLGNGVAVHVLKSIGLDLRKIRIELESRIQSGPEIFTVGLLPRTPRLERAIEYAIEADQDLNRNSIGTEHLLLGLLVEQDGVAAQVLMSLGVDQEEVLQRVRDVLNAAPEDKPATGP